MSYFVVSLVLACLTLAGCRDAPGDDDSGVTAGAAATNARGGVKSDSAAQAFGDTVAAMLLDTHLYELRGHLVLKIPNPDRLDESPLAERAVPHPAAPGPHTYTGTLHAELGALRAVLGDQVPVEVEGERVYVGRPPVLLLGHRHGEALYVPVKLFARQYGAYVDISCTLANCGAIWPREIIDRMRRTGYTGSAGVLEGHAEGLIEGVDVRALPGG